VHAKQHQTFVTPIEQQAAKYFLIPGIISLIERQSMHGHSPARVTAMNQNHWQLTLSLAKWRLADRVFHRRFSIERHIRLMNYYQQKNIS
jgi:hypothetical protein